MASNEKNKKKDRINEGLISGSTVGIGIDDYFLNVSKSICKIKAGNQEGSGFFLKYLVDNKYFYCLMSNEHIITKDLIQNNKSIIVYYDSEYKNIKIELNKKERYIQNFAEIDKNLDITVVQILPKDGISKIYFLLPELDIKDYKECKNREIYIPQYFLGQNLTISKGTLKDINKYEISYLASTGKGSSGSPIFLINSILVIGIHKQGSLDNKENYGNFIFPVLDKIKEYIQEKNKQNSGLKKSIIKIEYENGEYYIGDLINDIPNGKGTMYYSNNNIKYEGDFKKGKYEGKGKLYTKDGRYYIGDFLDGTLNGKGLEYNSDKKNIYEGDFVNGKYEGKGKYFWDNGEYYIGQFKDGAMHGKGTEYYNDKKIKYDGEYINGLYEGDGKYIFKSGNYYIGHYTKGQKNGEGIIFDKDGNIKEEGLFYNNKCVKED